MALQIQLRRGTTTQHSSFTGAMGEVTVDTSKNTLVLHDGTTVGGFPLTRSGEIVDNLTTDVSNKPLSAKQGKVLNESKVSNPTKIPANADLNDYKTVGLYFCDTDTTTILNNPTQYGFSLFVEKVSSTDVNQKLVVHKDGGGEVYIRSFSTSWSAWKLVTTKDTVKKHFGSQEAVVAPAGFNFHNMLVGDYVFKDLTVTTSPLNAPTFDYATVYCENTITGSSTNGKLLTAKEYSTGKVATKAFRNGVWSDWDTVPFEKDVLGGTYKDVTSTRLNSITYTNTSGKTIVICVIISNSNITFATSAGGYVGSNVVAYVTGSNGNSLSFSMVVPNNATYKYDYYTGTNVTCTIMELS